MVLEGETTDGKLRTTSGKHQDQLSRKRRMVVRLVTPSSLQTRHLELVTSPREALDLMLTEEAFLKEISSVRRIKLIAGSARSCLPRTSLKPVVSLIWPLDCARRLLKARFRDGILQFHRLVSRFEAFVVGSHENVDDSWQSVLNGLVRPPSSSAVLLGGGGFFLIFNCLTALLVPDLVIIE